MDKDSTRIPSNILLKSSYWIYLQKKEPNYLNETIYELYEYINKIDSNFWENIEVECKFGRFDFRGTYVYGYQFINETFKIPQFETFDKNYQMTFIPGLDERTFFIIWNNIEKESSNPSSEIIKLEPVSSKDIQYKSGKRKSLIFKDNELIREEIIKKEDKLHINIRSMGSDIRITACKEIKNEITVDDIPISTREKFRVSYKFRYFRLDFTIVKANDHDIIYEIEYEFDELAKFLNTPWKDASSKYEEFKMIFTRFIQNVFCIYSSTGLEYFNLSNKTKSKQIGGGALSGSLIGDYFEKN